MNDLSPKVFPCPLCAAASSFAFTVKACPICDCKTCGHRFAAVPVDERHVSTHYSDEYFYGGGAGYSDYSAEGEMLRKRGQMYAKKIARHAEPSNLLDIGAASGHILKGFIDSGWTGCGLEPNKTMTDQAREQLALTMHQGTLESFETGERFGLISMIQVAAHFYDPLTAFERARELLNANGLLLVETWDRSSMTARIFGRSWHEYSPPTVLHWFSKHGLINFLNDVGFQHIDGGRPSKKISGGHVRSLLKYRVGDNVLLKAIPEKIMFPYPSEDLFWALFRKA